VTSARRARHVSDRRCRRSGSSQRGAQPREVRRSRSGKLESIAYLRSIGRFVDVTWPARFQSLALGSGNDRVISSLSGWMPALTSSRLRRAWQCSNLVTTDQIEYSIHPRSRTGRGVPRGGDGSTRRKLIAWGTLQWRGARRMTQASVSDNRSNY